LWHYKKDGDVKKKLNMGVIYYLSVHGENIDDLILDKPRSYWINNNLPSMTLTWRRSNVADYEMETEHFNDVAVKRWVAALRADLKDCSYFLDDGGRIILTRSLCTTFPL